MQEFISNSHYKTKKPANWPVFCFSYLWRACSGYLFHFLLLKKNSPALLNSVCSVREPDGLEVHFSEYALEQVPDVVAARFFEPVRGLVPDVVAVHFSESVQEQSQIDVVPVLLVPAWPVQVPDEAVPADDQLLEDAALPGYFGFP